MRPLRIGLALAGGGARGLAHIGVLQVLHEHSVRPHCLAGTSAGAIVAAMYAARPEPDWIERRFREFLASEAFEGLGTERLARRYAKAVSSPFARRLQDHMVVNLSLLRRFLIPRADLEAAVRFLVPVTDFESLAMPLTVVAVDLQHCSSVAYRTGDLVTALCNSASIPGVLEPEFTENQVIVDGGVIMPVPVELLRSDSDFVIASEVSRRGLPPMSDINIYTMMMRAEQLTQMALASLQGTQADFSFCPDVMSLHWSQFTAFDVLLQNGIAEGQARSAALLKTLRAANRPQARLRRWLKTL